VRATVTVCMLVILLMVASGCGPAQPRSEGSTTRLYLDLSSCLRGVGLVREESGSWPRLQLLMLTRRGGLLWALVFRTATGASDYTASYSKQDAAYRRRARQAGISAPDGHFVKRGKVFVKYAGLDRAEKARVDRCLARLG
jgi:hypothetical protein